MNAMSDNRKNWNALSDQSGKPSLMRRMSVTSFVACILVAGIILLSEGPSEIRSPDVYIFTAFLLGAFFPKAVQRFAERAFPGASAPK